ncbi:hypothetical protein ACTFIV_009070 [Dictyostelium citrinum]
MNELLIKMNPENDNDALPLLTLPEQLFLLILNPETGKLPYTFVPLFHGFVGCGIAELQLMDKVIVTKQNIPSLNANKMLIKVIDHSKTGDTFLDYILSKLSHSSAQKGLPMATAILTISVGLNKMKRITETIAQSLIKKGFIRGTLKRSVLFKNKSIYEIIDYQAKLTVESSICKVLSTPPDYPDNCLRELIILLTFKQYEDFLIKPKLMDSLISRLYHPEQCAHIKANLRLINKNFYKEPSEAQLTNDPSVKMLSLIIGGIRNAITSE